MFDRLDINLIINSTVHIACANGAGMSGLLSILRCLNCKVTASDAAWGDEVLPAGTDILITSSAMNIDHPLILEARARGVMIMHRMDLICLLFEQSKKLIVLGSHGKTTTSGILANVLCDQSFVIGGLHLNRNANAEYVGKVDLSVSEYCVLETDESDRSFEKITPFGGIVTALSPEHLERYNYDFDNLKSAFAKYINNIQGPVVINKDDVNLAQLNVKALTYGQQGDYKLIVHSLDVFSVVRPNGEVISDIQLGVFGRHFIQNAAGVVALCCEIGVSVDQIRKGLAGFKGMGRRLEQLARKDKLIFIDDYAHCPQEIIASIAALKEQFAHEFLTIIFEPHQKQRLERSWMEFVKALEMADRVFVMDVFGARESLTVEQKHDVSMRLVQESDKFEHFDNWKQPAEGVVVAMGAGDSCAAIRALLN